MKAVFNGRVIAESDETVVVEGNHYFPRASVDETALRPSDKTSVCGWKGTANYFDVLGPDDAVAENAAWIYRETKAEAKNVEGYLAFWNGVEVVD